MNSISNVKSVLLPKSYRTEYDSYKINKTEKKAPDLNDQGLKNEILELIYKKNKYVR